MIAPLLAALSAVAAILSPPPSSPPPLPARALAPPAPPLPPAPALPVGHLNPVFAAARASTPVKLDGKLNDQVWSVAPLTDAFTQHYPFEGAAASEPTTVRVVYDDRALYIAIDCTQKSTPVMARLTRRDRVAASDRVTVDISSRSDRVTAFHFGVNAAGVLDDGIYFNDTQYSADWDENWQAETAVRPDGWSVEIKIPFRILRFDAAPAQRWGFQITRYTALRNETDLWAWRPRGAPGYVSTFGTLEGLVDVKPARPLELRFSEILQIQSRHHEARAGTLAPGRDWDWNWELSGKGHPTQGTTLDVAVNPDFGLVEADQVVLNLSNYEVFYPEKRPFFIEGQDSWATPRSIFYTRRIGAKPADPVLASGDLLGDRVAPSRIWGAAKLVGAATPRSSVGLLSAVTGENRVEIVRGNGTPARTVEERTIDPWTVFNVLRARYLPGLAGDVGVLATATNRVEGAPPGGARRTSDAYAAAIDGRWRSPSANYVLSGQVVGSLLVNGPARAQSDGIAILPGHPDFGATVTAAKQGGANWLASLTQAVSGRRLEYNDLGYLDRKNDSFSYADLTYRTLKPWWKTTDTATTLAVSHRHALDGIRLEDHFRLSSSATFSNFWGASLTGYYHAPHFDDRETRDGTALERAGRWGTELWVGTDARGLFTGSMWAQAQRLGGGVQVQASANLVMRPTANVDLELAPQAFYSSGEARFIESDPAANFYFFGKLRARQVGITARATVGLSPRLTLQFYSQLFLATKEYTSPSQFHVSGGAFRSQVRIADLQPIAAWAVPDTQQATLNVNAVLRWEYRFGSIVYLIYTRVQSPTLSPSGAPQLDAGPLRGNRGSTDTLMLKATYWWG